MAKKEQKINFRLLDTQIILRFVDKIEDDEKRYYGLTQYKLSYVDVQIATKDNDGNDLSEDTIKATILHELIHVIFDKMYFRTESDNESLVEWTAQSLHSILKQGLYKQWEK
jgi:hypothetical protein